jgi:hypothetical protein
MIVYEVRVCLSGLENKPIRHIAQNEHIIEGKRASRTSEVLVISLI